MLLFVRLSPDSTYVADILPGIMLASIGMGLVFVPLTLIATSGVPVDDAGLASGLFNTSQQIGGALGLALLSTFAANKTADVLASTRRQADRRPRRRRRSSTASTSPGSGAPHSSPPAPCCCSSCSAAATCSPSPTARPSRSSPSSAGARVGCRREDRAVPDRAVLRRPRVHGAVHALVERRRVGRDRRPARARAGCLGAAPGAAARLHRVGRCARAAGRDRSDLRDPVAGRRRRRRGGGGRHLRRLPRAPRAGRPRGRRDAVLRVGAPGRALCGGDGDRVAALGERRLGARPRRSPDARCGRTRSSSTSTARTTRPGC